MTALAVPRARASSAISTPRSASHFQMAIAERIAAGEDPESARLAAINEFGNPLQTKEEARAGVARRPRRDGRRRLAGRALRRPHARQESRLLARRHRGAVARHCRQRRDLQPVQGHRAQAAAGCARLGDQFRAAQPDHRRPRHRRIGAGLSRHRGTTTILRAPHGVDDGVCGPRAGCRRPARDRGARRRQLLRDAWRRRATRPHAAAVGRCGAGTTSGRGHR